MPGYNKNLKVTVILKSMSIQLFGEADFFFRIAC